jgi:endonuclease-3
MAAKKLEASRVTDPDPSEVSRAREVIDRLRKQYPNAKIALNFRNAYELLVATILSAQSTDRKINEITPALFEKYPDPRALAEAPLHDVEQLVRQAGFFRVKARYITAAAKTIVERFGGRVPDTMEELMELPGVARKTANIILANAFGKVEGIAVDTHVQRLARRLGFSRAKNPDAIEQDLMRLFPREDWYSLNYLLIEHGRAVCKAPVPKCDACVVADLCPSAFSFARPQATRGGSRSTSSSDAWRG